MSEWLTEQEGSWQRKYLGRNCWQSKYWAELLAEQILGGIAGRADGIKAARGAGRIYIINYGRAADGLAYRAAGRVYS